MSAKHINRGVEGSPPPPPPYPSLPLPSSSAKKGSNQSNLKVLNYLDRRGLKWTFSFISLHRELHSLLFISSMCDWSKQIRKKKLNHQFNLVPHHYHYHHQLNVNWCFCWIYWNTKGKARRKRQHLVGKKWKLEAKKKVYYNCLNNNWVQATIEFDCLQMNLLAICL